MYWGWPGRPPGRVGGCRRESDRIECNFRHRGSDECDGLVREAEEARAQILEDMERRRRQARAQVERLRVGRDRLLRSYEVVRRPLEETTVELKSSLNEAKVRGDGLQSVYLAVFFKIHIYC